MNTHKDRNELWELIVLISMIVLMILGLSSCKQIQYVPVIKYKTDSVYVEKIKYDSIEIKVKEYSRQDTVYRDSVVVRYQHRVDTIYKVDRDSIPYPVEVVKEVKAPLNLYEKTMIRLGWALIALVVAIVGWKVAKWYFKRTA
jgi:hypothetical protein